MDRSCVNCSGMERNKRGACVICERARQAAWRAANPEKVTAYAARTYAKDPESVKAVAKEWYEANREKVMLRKAAYRAANADKINAAAAAYREANREKVRAASATWRSQNPEVASQCSAAWSKENRPARRVIDNNRRARIKAVGGTLSKGLAEKLFAVQKGLCACCRQPLGHNYHMDHILPLALGGTNTDDNVQLLRQKCNNQKGAKHPIDFMQQRGLLL